MKPFSDNVVFWDTEFSTDDPREGEIISLGMVKKSGEELYLELEHDGLVGDWVRENVIPLLTGQKSSREEARRRIEEFLGDGKPFLVGYYDNLDASFLYKLFYEKGGKRRGFKNMPWHWVTVDFASLLFALGIDPERMSSTHPVRLPDELGINIRGYRHHHALDDAKLLREVYLKLMEAII